MIDEWEDNVADGMPDREALVAALRSKASRMEAAKVTYVPETVAQLRMAAHWLEGDAGFIERLAKRLAVLESAIQTHRKAKGRLASHVDQDLYLEADNGL